MTETVGESVLECVTASVRTSVCESIHYNNYILPYVNDAISQVYISINGFVRPTHRLIYEYLLLPPKGRSLIDPYSKIRRH